MLMQKTSLIKKNLSFSIGSSFIEEILTEFMIQLIESLSDYKEKNGGDIIIDLLFTKYLIHANTEDLIKAVQALSEKENLNHNFTMD